MGSDPKKNKKHAKKVFTYFLLGGFLLESIRHFAHKRKINKNFHRFLKEEKKEITEFSHGDESIKAFSRHTGSILADFFLPNKNNNYHPRILATKSLTIIVVVLTIIKMALAGYLFFVLPNAAQMSESLTNELLAKINTDRSAVKLDTLHLDPALSKSAVAKAEDMLAQNYFAHHNPEGKKPWDFIDRNDYAYIFVGENLAMNFTSAESVHKALMKSPSHKKNILNERYQDVGLAVATGEINGQNTNILVELFATRQPTVLASAEEKTAVEPIPVAAESVENVQVLAETSAEETKTEVSSANREVALLGVNTVDSGALVENKKAEPVMTKEQVVAPVKDINPSPNRAIEAGTDNELTLVEQEPGPEVLTAAKKVKLVKYLFILVLLVIILTLLIKIFVKMKIQHHSVIWQTILVIVFISGLIYLRLHLVDGPLPPINLM